MDPAPIEEISNVGSAPASNVIVTEPTSPPDTKVYSPSKFKLLTPFVILDVVVDVLSP